MDTVGYGRRQKSPRALSRFGLPLLVRAENNPGYFRVASFAKKSEDRPAAADFNIIRMSSETENYDVLTEAISTIYLVLPTLLAPYLAPKFTHRI